jgi:hypothetical protein
VIEQRLVTGKALGSVPSTGKIVKTYLTFLIFLKIKFRVLSPPIKNSMKLKKWRYAKPEDLFVVVLANLCC